MIPSLNIKDYNYPLTNDRIAKYPLPQRDASKLLLYGHGCIADHTFRELPGLLPENALMVFNDTKVVPARLYFRKETGALIEIFCLQPVQPVEYALCFAATAECSWQCVIGNAKKWKGEILSVYNPENNGDIAALGLMAKLMERNGRTATVEFSWEGKVHFSKVLETCGTVPIPPYLDRESEEIDSERYQTLYARIRGSVAAPTAGLHFTDEVLENIKDRGIEMENVCLHVGAGTFLPVKDADVSRHPMHREPFSVSVDLLRKLRDKGDRKLIAVGTTSVRSLESLYYAGVKCMEQGRPADIEQWIPYTGEYGHSREEALDALINYLEINNLKELRLGTRIIIVPGFRFRLTDLLVTNFHQPESTLILLVSAFVNGDWKRIYSHALSHNYRFLSYGDSSLLIRP